MKKILFAIFIFSIYFSLLNAQTTNNTPSKETITYKAISKKTKKSYIIEYKIQRGESLILEEYRVDGYMKKNVKLPSELYKDNIDIRKEVSNYILIDIESKRVIYSKTTEKYEFGVIKREFDIRNTVNIKDKEGELSVFSYLAIEQIARLYQLDNIKEIAINMKTSPNENMRTVLHNNGIKSISINGKPRGVYEIEIKLEGIPMTMLFPKMYIYVEEDYPHRVVKFNNMTGMMDSFEFVLTDYKVE